MKNVLVIENNNSLRYYLVRVLNINGYHVFDTDTCKEGLELFALRDIDLLIMDMNIVKNNCRECCKKFRYKPNTAILIISDSLDDLKHYRCTYDDYIIKPIDVKDLISKCQHLLSNLLHRKSNANVLHCNGIIINKNAYTVEIDSEYVDFPRKEFELLAYLVENEGVVLTRENILNTIWGFDYIGDYRVVDTVIKKIRKKLKNKSKYIHTIFRVGYRFQPSSDNFLQTRFKTPL